MIMIVHIITSIINIIVLIIISRPLSPSRVALSHRPPTPAVSPGKESGVFGGTQTGSYQTGSYQKGRFIPPKPTLFCFAF